MIDVIANYCQFIINHSLIFEENESLMSQFLPRYRSIMLKIIYSLCNAFSNYPWDYSDIHLEIILIVNNLTCETSSYLQPTLANFLERE